MDNEIVYIARLEGVLETLKEMCSIASPNDQEFRKGLKLAVNLIQPLVEKIVEELSQPEKYKIPASQLPPSDGILPTSTTTDIYMTPLDDFGINRLVIKFLQWPLPLTVCSDECVTRAFQIYQTGTNQIYRTGTNLLTYDEARKMIQYLLTSKE